MKTSKNLFFQSLPVVAALMLCVSCKKDKPEPAPPAVVPEPAGQKVYVVNEGNYGQNNGSVSLYDPAKKTVDPNRFGSQNGGAKLGDTPQSMTLIGSSYYIVVNNSGKIVQCDLELKKQKEITGFTSPRYVLPFNADKAYVSDLADPVLKVLNLASGSVEQTVPLTAPAERLLALNSSKVYATSFSRDYVYVIDVPEQKVSDSVFVGPGAGSLQLDKESNLWVLSTGDYANIGGRLSKIRTSDNTVLKSMSFPGKQFPSRLTLSVTKDTLYYLLNGINVVQVSNPQLPPSPMVPAGLSTFYGLGVNPKNGQLYVSDAMDFSQASSVFIYSSKGDSLSHFKAGTTATDFLFN